MSCILELLKTTQRVSPSPHYQSGGPATLAFSFFYTKDQVHFLYSRAALLKCVEFELVITGAGTANSVTTPWDLELQSLIMMREDS